ncbi:hypothetical protein BRD01_05375 [Halobacteriales archaeon QS_8_65_32]|nr:MAG: hypothetical protein BRD01_05375 [Halobacteriales archaeon QS_8_65_32]
MERLELALVVCVAASVLLGGFVAADVGSSFRTAGLAGPVSEQVTVETTAVTLRDDRLVVTARLENPTRYRLRLTGVFAQVSANDSRLVYGSHSYSDPVAIDARSTRRVEYSISLAPAGERRLRRVRRYSLRLGETTLVVRHATPFDEPIDSGNARHVGGPGGPGDPENAGDVEDSENTGEGGTNP